MKHWHFIAALMVVMLPRLVLTAVGAVDVADSYPDVSDRIDVVCDRIDDEDNRRLLAVEFERVGNLENFQSVGPLIDELNEAYFTVIDLPNEVVAWDSFKVSYVEAFTELNKAGRVDGVDDHLRAIRAMAEGLRR